MRKDISFHSKGLRCCGWLYVPDGLPAGSKAPAIVMAHGFSAVKEMYLDLFAEQFVAAGFVTLVFDYRHFGGSEGEPRGQLFPYEQHEDYRNAVSWLTEQPEVDRERIGIWGTSFSGGHVIHLAVIDRRIKAVVAQIPAILSGESRRADDPVRFEQAGRLLLQERIDRYKTGKVNYLRVVAPAGEPCVLATADAYEWFMEGAEIAPNWTNGVTCESMELIREYDAARYIRFVAPTPLLMIVAEHDSLIPAKQAVQVYERAAEPKRLIQLPCGHFDLYRTEPWFSKASGAAIEWFEKHL
jgi:uncharacterized protein